MRIGWVTGWAVPTDWFEGVVRSAMPSAEHRCFSPTSRAFEQLEAARSFDHVVGYSLGSLVLLEQAARASRIGQVSLLAPIFAFPAEQGLGGRVSVTQVRHLSRWLRRARDEALADFYRRAGLALPFPLALTEPTEDLQWGLGRLADVRVDPPLPDGWCAWCGEQDALLDVVRLRTLEPRIATVTGATHDPMALVAAFAGGVA